MTTVEHEKVLEKFQEMGGCECEYPIFEKYFNRICCERKYALGKKLGITTPDNLEMQSNNKTQDDFVFLIQRLNREIRSEVENAQKDKKYERYGVTTLEELLFYFPFFSTISQDVIQYDLGINGYEKLTPQQIAKRLNTTRNCIYHRISVIKTIVNEKKNFQENRDTILLESLKKKGIMLKDVDEVCKFREFVNKNQNAKTVFDLKFGLNPDTFPTAEAKILEILDMKSKEFSKILRCTYNEYLAQKGIISKNIRSELIRHHVMITKRDELQAFINEVFRKKKGKESTKRILELHFGLIDGKEWEYREIAKQEGVSFQAIYCRINPFIREMERIAKN